MSPKKPVSSATVGACPTRFIGLDVHKHDLIAIGVDAELNQVLGPRRAQLRHLDAWMRNTLTRQDAVVGEGV